MEEVDAAAKAEAGTSPRTVAIPASDQRIDGTMTTTVEHVVSILSIPV